MKKSLTSNSAFVSVPVLSNTATSHFARLSKNLASLKSTLFLKATPRAQTLLTGVARASAQGQAITMTLTAVTIAPEKPNLKYQNQNVKNANVSTLKENLEAILLTTSSIFGFFSSAFWSKFMS